MRRLYSAFLSSALFTLVAATQAAAAEGYILSMDVEYRIHPQSATNAATLGMAPSDRISLVLEFARPECLVDRTSKTQVSYLVTGGTVKMLGAQHNLALDESAYITLYDEQTDRFELQLRMEGFAGSPFAPFTSLRIANTTLPADAIQALDFPSDPKQIERYLRAPGNSANFGEATFGSINLVLSGVTAKMRYLPANATAPTCK